jgi:hypothetical protein
MSEPRRERPHEEHVAPTRLSYLRVYFSSIIAPIGAIAFLLKAEIFDTRFALLRMRGLIEEACSSRVAMNNPA